MGQADPGITASYHASVDLGKKPHFTYTFIAMIDRRTEGQSSKKGRGEVRRKARSRGIWVSAMKKNEVTYLLYINIFL